MKIELSSNWINKISNTNIGTLFFVVVPSFYSYTKTFNDFSSIFTIYKMEITIAFLASATIYLLIKTSDLKIKITKLKNFRDYEAISMANFYNSEIKKLNDRLLATEKKLDIDVNSNLNENEKRLFQEEKKNRDKVIREYNETFKNFETFKYGEGDMNTYYKNLNYKE